MGAACVAQWATGPNEDPNSVRIVRAELHGNLFRGVENVLTGKFKKAGSTRTFGRDPRDAMIITQRNCGVCPIGHGTTANQNIGTLLGYKVHDEDTGNALPPNAATLRNLLLGANHIMSHILHFYHLVALDFVNPIVGKPFLCPRYDDSYYINDCRVLALAGTGVLTQACLNTLINLPGWGTLGPGAAVNAYLVKRYLAALDARRLAHEMLAIFGGKGPIVAAYTPGGVTATVDQTRIAAFQTKLNALKTFVGEPRDFMNGVANTMMFDTVAAAHLFPEYFWIGNAWNNYMAYGWGESNTSTTPVALSGDFGAVLGSISNTDNRLSRRGCVVGGTTYTDFTAGRDSSANDRIVEAIAHSQYSDTVAWRHPYDGKTAPLPLARETSQGVQYSWLKAPRYRTGAAGTEAVCEVGPLSRMVVQGTYYAGILNDPNLPLVGALYPAAPQPGQPGPDLSGVGASGHPITDLIAAQWKGCYGNAGPDLRPIAYNGDSILDRVAARTIECRIMIDMAQHELNKLVAGQSGATDPPPKANASGYGMSEASRGALGHWIKTDSRGRIKLYQCIVPTTWNGSPRDANGNPGPAEKSLQGANTDVLPQDPSPAGQGVWIKDPNQPIELIRTTHSYDFCIACAVHIVTPDGEVRKVVVPPLP